MVSSLESDGNELSKLGPGCSESSLHGFAVCSNSCLSVAYLLSTCEMDVREEEEEERVPLRYMWILANAFTFNVQNFRRSRNIKHWNCKFRNTNTKKPTKSQYKLSDITLQPIMT